MIVYDLNSGHREYPGYDEIEDRRGGGRGRSRRSDGTYMGYGHPGFLPPYDHYGMHEKMKEMEEREDELEERERRLEERERRHEMEDREYRRMGYESYPIDYYGDDRYYGPRSFRWCGSHSKKYDSRIPVFPVWKKKNKNVIPVGGQ